MGGFTEIDLSKGPQTVETEYEKSKQLFSVETPSGDQIWIGLEVDLGDTLTALHVAKSPGEIPWGARSWA